MAMRDSFNSARICGVTLMGVLILYLALTIAPRIAEITGVAGDLRDIDIMALDD